MNFHRHSCKKFNQILVGTLCARDMVWAHRPVPKESGPVPKESGYTDERIERTDCSEIVVVFWMFSIHISYNLSPNHGFYAIILPM